MENQQQTAPGQQREIVFGDDGLPLSESVIAAAPTEPEPLEETVTPENPPTEPTRTKYRIGDREFETADEALTFARSQVSTMETEQQVAAAYRQGIQDAVSHPVSGQNVTPPAAVQPPIRDEEFYANPTAAIQKYGQQIRAETEAAVSQRIQQQMAAGQAWLDFSARHPDLADFRGEVESYTNANFQDLKAISATKGPQAAYDYIATKLKSQFQKYGDAMKPKKSLPNVGTQTPPASQGTRVTPNPEGRKALTFTDQMRSLRKKQR